MNAQPTPSPLPPEGDAQSAAEPMRAAILDKLEQGLAPSHLEVVNESGNHNVPAGSETHFKVVVVSPQFEGKRLLQRHRLVYSLVRDELASGVHALAVHAFTEADWPDADADVTTSPNCRGGKASESTSNTSE